MAFIEGESFEWTQEGTAPTESKKSTGWILNEKPFFAVWNWFFKRVSNALKNINHLNEAKVEKTTTINSKALTGNIVLDASDINDAVPNTLTINGNPLDNDITLTAEDIGAISNDDPGVLYYIGRWVDNTGEIITSGNTYTINIPNSKTFSKVLVDIEVQGNAATNIGVNLNGESVTTVVLGISDVTVKMLEFSNGISDNIVLQITPATQEIEILTVRFMGVL